MAQTVLQSIPVEFNAERGPKIRIAYVSGSLRSGGTEGQVVELLRHIDRTQFEPFLILMEETGIERAEGLVADCFVIGIPQARNSHWIRRSASLAWSVLRTARMLREWKCNVVHAFLPGPSILAGAAARLAHVPVVVGSRRSLPSQYRSGRRTAAWADSAALRIAAYNLGNSRAVTQEMLSLGSCPPQKCGTILNGVDTRRFKPTRISDLRRRLGWVNGEVVFGLLGNFRDCKRHADFVAAAALISQYSPSARFVMAGSDNGTREAVRRQVRDLGLQGRVEILESNSSPEAVLSAMDIYVCASGAEGLSNSILEAMASGKPVIATRVGGDPELVVDGETGFLVPPFAPQAIAEAADRLIVDEPLRLAMGERARRRAVEHFSLEAMISAHERLYLQLLGRTT